jgi:DNA-binding SARP family transcriptional activator
VGARRLSGLGGRPDRRGTRLAAAQGGGLIKLLALAPGHRLHRERVADALWPDFDAKAATNNLHRALHLARAALGHGSAGAGSPYLRLEGDLVALCPDGELWVDAEAFVIFWTGYFPTASSRCASGARTTTAKSEHAATATKPKAHD